MSAGLAAGGLDLCFTFFGGGGGGRGTLCAEGAGKGEANGVSVFGCCCAVVGGFSVPLPVCNGGACACCGGELLWNKHPVHKKTSRVAAELTLAALIPWAPLLRLIQLSYSRPASSIHALGCLEDYSAESAK